MEEDDDHTAKTSTTSLQQQQQQEAEEEKKQPDSDQQQQQQQQQQQHQQNATSSPSSPNIQDEEGLDHSQPPEEDSSHATTTPWKPQTSQSTCEFTHTITNYSQKRESGCKKAEYSSTTVDEFGNRWRLIVYVNGNGRASNHHLSLFLQVRACVRACVRSWFGDLRVMSVVVRFVSFRGALFTYRVFFSFSSLSMCRFLNRLSKYSFALSHTGGRCGRPTLWLEEGSELRFDIRTSKWCQPELRETEP